MLYGFLGVQPTVEGFTLAPRLPKDWPSLSVTAIHIHDHVLDVTAEQSGKVRFKIQQAGTKPLVARIAGRTISLPASPSGPVIEVVP
jgi:cellobiose phosphorylase